MRGSVRTRPGQSRPISIAAPPSWSRSGTRPGWRTTTMRLWLLPVTRMTMGIAVCSPSTPGGCRRTAYVSDEARVAARSGDGMTLEFGVLGPIEVRRDHVLVALGGPQQRRIVAALLAERGQVLSIERLV